MLYHIFDVSYLFSTLNHKRGKVVRGYFTLYIGLLKMIVGVLTTCHTQYT